MPSNQISTSEELDELRGSLEMDTAIISGATFANQAVTYYDVDGIAMVEGDIALGTVEEVKAATENARLNQLSDRLELVLGGPDVVSGNWPVVVANVLAAPLIEMAPILVQRLGRRGRLILSGIHSSLESEVRGAYQHCGIRLIDSKTRAGWTAMTATSIPSALFPEAVGPTIAMMGRTGPL